MSDLRFRNVDVDPRAPLSEWPAEAIETIIDRGTLKDWRLLAAEIRRSPWGRVARTVEEIVGWDEHGSVDALFGAALEAARSSVALGARRAEAARLRELRARTGLSLRAFAALAGTSASRLSDYENAKVAPTSDAIGRLEHAASVSPFPQSTPANLLWAPPLERRRRPPENALYPYGETLADSDGHLL